MEDLGSCKEVAAKVKLSVIIPSLDGFVPKALPSSNDLEIIVVAGVSPVSAARNKGLRRAQGEYVAWIDSDDEVSEDWLSDILHGLETRPDVLSFNVRVEWEHGNRPPYTVGGCAYAADVMAERVNGQLWNKVIRRELFRGLSFKGVAHEDYRLLCELLPRAGTFAHVDKELYVYRRGASGLSQYVNANSARKAIEELMEFSENAPDKWRHEIKKGVAQRAADFCRNAESLPELRRFIMRAIPSIFADGKLSLRAKAKCLLAGLGL